MIKATEINTVYFSELLKTDSRFSLCYENLIAILDRHQISHRLICHTKDIWCRDYMPIQVGKSKMVQFRYEPSYLKEELNLQSDPLEVCKSNQLEPVFSNINLDGGNVVSYGEKAILTDRIFSENPEYTSRNQLISDLENLLEAEVIIIPQINSDYTGHADGMVRFTDSNTLIGNDRAKEYQYWRNGINKVLKQYHLDYIDTPFFTHKIKAFPDNALGCYMNYLEVGNLIVLPRFEVADNCDDEVLELFKRIFPDRKIESIHYNEVGKYGGLLNCTTWNIREN